MDEIKVSKTNVRYHIYFDIVAQTYRNLINFEKTYEEHKYIIERKIGDDRPTEEDVNKIIYINDILGSINNASTIIIVFSAFILEAYIWDYAITYLKESYVKEHLERLNIISKWVLILKLVNNYDFDKSDNNYRLFKKLIDVRNEYAHSKTKLRKIQNISPIKELQAIADDYNKSYIPVHEAIKVLFYLDNLLREINKDDANYEPIINIGLYFTFYKYPELEEFLFPLQQVEIKKADL